MASEPVILLDMMNLVFRAHFSHLHLADEDGHLTGVQYGVLKTIADLRENVSKRIVIVWDHGIPVLGAQKPRNWRDDILKSYKATRPPNEAYPLIVPQLLPLSSAIEHVGYQNIGVMGLEADDVIGILSQTMRSEVLIFSTDKDMYQLLEPNRVRILVPKKENGKFRYITAADVEAEYTVPIKRWAEYLALGGDSADNIKPLKGMGPKTAAKLIRDGVHLDWPLEKQPAAIERYRAAWSHILKSYEAARIPTDPFDSRVRHLIPNGYLSSPTGKQFWPDEATRRRSQKLFDQFCADRDMYTIFAIRRKFFESETPKGEQPCTVSLPTPPKIRPKRPSLFDI